MKNNFNPLKTTLFLITLISFINFSFAQDKKGRSERIDRKESRDITKTRDQKVRDLPEKANTKIEGNRIQKNKDVSFEKRGQSTRNNKRWKYKV